MTIRQFISTSILLHNDIDAFNPSPASVTIIYLFKIWKSKEKQILKEMQGIHNYTVNIKPSTLLQFQFMPTGQ